MDGITKGTGLAALGFWLFVAAMVVVGVWSGIRKRDAMHETLRRMIESGQPIDTDLANQLLSGSNEKKDVEQDLKVGGWITLALAPGLAVFGWVLGTALTEELTYILGGVALLVLFISAGLFLAANGVRKMNANAEVRNG